MKKIATALFTLLVLFSSKVYGYGLEYLVSSTDPKNQNNFTMLTMVQAYKDSINEFDSKCSTRGTFIKADSTKTIGGTRSFRMQELALHKNPKQVKTQYDPGFANDSNAINAFYDNSTEKITIASKDFDSFYGIKTHIKKNQTLDTTGDYIFKYGDGNDNIKASYWSVTGNNVRLDTFKFPDQLINCIMNNYTDAERREGIRFSNIANTTDERIPTNVKSKMDTTYKFFNTTVGYWFGTTRGYNENDAWLPTSTGTYKKGASAANIYDNIMYFEVGEPAKTYVFINTVDSNGNVLNTKINDIEGGKDTDRCGFKREHVIDNNDQLDIWPHEEFELEGKKYKYSKGIDASSNLKKPELEDPDIITAIEKLKKSGNEWQHKKFKPFTKPTVIVVNLVYNEVNRAEETDIPLKLVGKLCFINDKDDEFKSSTSSIDKDYIASSPDDANPSLLKPYIFGAYEYVLRALRFTPEEATLDKNKTYKMGQSFSYTLKWGDHSGCASGFSEPTTYGTGVVHYGHKLKDNPTPEHEHTDSCYTRTLVCNNKEEGHKHTEACYGNVLNCNKYHKHYFNSPSSQCGCYIKDENVILCKDLDESGEYSISVKYNLNVTHNFYQVTNFKMYRIKDFILHDNDNNVGGKLFENADGQVIETSEEYNNKFKKGEWKKVNPKIDISMASDNMLSASNAGKLDNVEAVKTYLQGIEKNVQDVCPENASTLANNKQLKFTFNDFRNNYLKNIIGCGRDVLKPNLLEGNDAILKVNSANNFKNNVEITINKGHCKADDNGKPDVDSPTTEVSLKDEVIDNRKDKEYRNQSYVVEEKEMEKNYVDNVPYFFEPTYELTNKEDFEEKWLKIPVERDNGERILSATIKYIPVDNDIYNIGSDNFNAQTATYDGYYTKRKDGKTGEYLIDEHFVRDEHIKDYKEYNDIKKEVNVVNVFTPIGVQNFELTTKDQIVHLGNDKDATVVLQKNVPFTITPSQFMECKTIGYDIESTQKYIRGYYYIFDFDVAHNGTQYKAYTPIRADGASTAFIGIPYGNTDSMATDLFKNHYKIIGIPKNMPPSLEDYMVDFIKTHFIFKDELPYSFKGNYNFINENQGNKNFDVLINNNKNNHNGHGTRNDLINDVYHIFATENQTTSNLTRIFDFKVTDCTDLAYKDVFRKTNDKGAYVNSPTGNVYYGGTKYWDYKNYENPNVMVEHTSNLKIPLGPRSHNGGKYFNAPKMGYRISYDFKTTGYMDESVKRYAEIKPKYYYISKDANTFIEGNEFKLYYLDDKNKYKELDNNYSIYYKPDDGYRYIANTELGINNNKFLSKDFIRLNISDIIIGSNAIAFNNTNFIQAWYGEFKLPNSTIAVKNENDINEPLKDGYLGVVFDISVNDGENILNYGVDNKNAHNESEDDENEDPTHNTSQWDYEGFMGFDNPGHEANLDYKLENGTWHINDATYQKIKGTVLLYDLDNRAANDFE